MEAKFTESEYNTLANGLGLEYRRGFLTREDYHELLKKLATFRSITKPEVKIARVQFEQLGNAEVAHGLALNHPRLGRADVRTSLVVFKAEDGSFFETLNTRYVIVDTTGVPDTESTSTSV